MRKFFFFIVPIMMIMGSCSSDVKIESDGNGNCVSKRSKEFLGITYSESENMINCTED